jgi:pyruvate/2-oxoglutarate dehydrogenase complex dihydrolipoamide dehydrogenase (E3) component
MNPRRQYRCCLSVFLRAHPDVEGTGFIEVVADAKGVIVGGTVVGERAGELFNALSIAMTNGVSPSGLNNTIFAYPTESELLKRVGDAYSKTRLTPTVATVLKTLIRWRR